MINQMGKISKIVVATTAFLALAPKVLAVDINISPPPQANGLQDPNLVASAPQFLVTLLFVVAVIVAIVFLIYGGIKWILSGGDKAKVEEARKTIIGAIVGLIIAFLAYFILTLVLSIFGLSLTKLTLPTITK